MTNSDDSLRAVLAVIEQQQRQIDALIGLGAAAQLGTAPAAAGLPLNPVTVAELVATYEAVTKSDSLRTYRSGLHALRDGMPKFDRDGKVVLDKDGKPVMEVEGLGNEMAHKVLAGDLVALISPIQARAKRHNERRDNARAVAERQTREGTGLVAVYNAVGAWRSLFSLGIKNKHLPVKASR